MVSRVDVIGLDPRKSFLSPIDLIPFLGGGMKIYKGGRLAYHGGKQIAKGSLALTTGKVTTKFGVASGGAVRLAGAAAVHQGGKLVRKGTPDLLVGAASIYGDYVMTKMILQKFKGKSPHATETQRVKSSRNVGSKRAPKKLPRRIPRRNGRCPNGYRFSRKLNACVRK